MAIFDSMWRFKTFGLKELGFLRRNNGVTKQGSKDARSRGMPESLTYVAVSHDPASAQAGCTESLCALKPSGPQCRNWVSLRTSAVTAVIRSWRLRSETYRIIALARACPLCRAGV